MITVDERKTILYELDVAILAGASAFNACFLIGLSLRTRQRWQSDQGGIDKRSQTVKQPKNALTSNERAEILRVCTSEAYKDMAPNEIVPLMAEKGQYIGSESSFYRILKVAGMLKHRSESKVPHRRYTPEELTATGPDQIWSWDITYMKTSIRGIYYYLYLFMDVWSRMIVGWCVEEKEDGDIAAKKVAEIRMKHGAKGVYLHSDNGGPMKSGTMLATLQWLGVIPSFSRPSVSNDNPYSESLFKTMKYRPAYPKEFASIEDAREWVEKFVIWYNTKHHHSGIHFVTPEDRHEGRDEAILAKRIETYELARLRNPNRWSGVCRNWEKIKEVTLNKKSTRKVLEKCA